MTRYTSLDAEQECAAFIREAIQNFADNPELYSYGGLEPDSYLAIRWGLLGRSMMVIRIDPNFEPVCVRDAIPT